jgi:hypothetical protein
MESLRRLAAGRDHGGNECSERGNDSDYSGAPE